MAAQLAVAMGTPGSALSKQRHPVPLKAPVTRPDGTWLPQKVSQERESLPSADFTSKLLGHGDQNLSGAGLGAAMAGISAALAGAAVAARRLTTKTAADPLPLAAEPASGTLHTWETALATLLLTFPASPAMAAAAEPGYSLASYYTALGTFLLALPGLVSLVTRSVKSKVVRKTYVLPGPKAPGGLPQKEVAGKLLFYLTKKRGLELKEAGKTVTFRGRLPQRQGQAAFLTFCVSLCLLSLGLVIQTIEAASLGEGKGLGIWWYAIAALSPLAGKYYLDNAETEQELQLRIVTDDGEKETEVVVQGDDAELEALRLEFDWPEKGLVRVKGLLEDQIRGTP